MYSTAFAFLRGEQNHKESMARFLFTDASIKEEGERLGNYMTDCVYVGEMIYCDVYLYLLEICIHIYLFLNPILYKIVATAVYLHWVRYCSTQLY